MRSLSDGGLQVALVLNATMTFMILGLATDRFFRCPTADAPWRMRVHRFIGMLFSVLHVVALATQRTPSAVAMGVALGLYFAGLALFFWAQEAVKGRPPSLTFSGVLPDSLITTGPFSFVRHPFYVAFSLIWWAGAVGTLSLWVAASALWMTGSYVVAAREEEHAFALGPLRESYRLYAEKAGRWWPSFERLTGIPVPRRVRTIAGRMAAAVVLVLAAALMAMLFASDDPR